MAQTEATHSPTDVTKYLKGVDFPAKRADLVQTAKHNHADQQVMKAIEAMPDHEYHTMADIMKGFGQHH